MSAPRTREDLVRSFLLFTSFEDPRSELYAGLAPDIVSDEELLTLAALARAGQPAAHLLFGAVHAMLLRDPGQPLAAYYPTVGGDRPPDARAFALFRALVLDQRPEVAALVSSRLTQTNETRRCVYLLPAFGLVARRAGDRPLALIELGPSAGLNLSWDRYGYDYGDGRIYGDPSSPVRLTTELRGRLRPPIPERMPAVAWRTGVELSPVDLDDPAAVRWLEALVWPEHVERLARLRAAVAVARASRPPIVAGDALALLPGLIAQAPAEAMLCVYHTHVTYQLGAAGRSALDALLADAGHERSVLRLGCEGSRDETPRLVLTGYSGGAQEERLLALASGHASWLEWKDQGAAQVGRI